MDDSALPSVAEILASEQRLTTENFDFMNQVVRVRERFAVKYGYHVNSSEADTLRLLADTAVPVPRIYGFISDPGTKKSFLTMEFIEGQTLEDILPSLSIVEQHDIFEQIQKALVHLRSLEPPGYIGSIGRKPLLDGIFNVEPVDPATCGPFACQEEMNKGILKRFAERDVPAQVNLVRQCIESTLRGHRTVFTHADLQPKNIMVSRKGTKQDGVTGIFEIKIIDWEISGWYPEYWEFCTASIWGSKKPEWIEAVQSIMTVYPKEFLMLQFVRSRVFLLG